MDLSQLRRTYQAAPFDPADAAEDPFVQFERWFLEVSAAVALLELNAAVLSTAGADGRPSSRHVLVKGVGPDGFLFFTNHHSRKATQLAVNPWASLVMAWSPLGRQVVAEGPVARTSDAQSDDYFARRPRGSQLGAWASPQSEPLGDRDELDAAYAAAEARYAGGPVPRPPHWGGFRLAPERVEFWQGRESRMHDRVVYTPAPDGGWQRQRLAP